MIVFIAIRSFVFYIGYIVSTILWGSFATAVGLCLPKSKRFGFVTVRWTSFVLWWLRLTCGIKTNITGIAHLDRSAPAILFVQHQTTWDALFSTQLTSPQVTVVKRGLLWIPFFGWAFGVSNPITLDRNQLISGIKRMVREGTARMNQGEWVTIFPEGTRMPAGTVGDFRQGGARLAVESGADVYVVAHNGGRYWPRNRFLKWPGTINVEISPPFSPVGLTQEELNRQTESWMRNALPRVDDVPAAR